MTLKMWLYMRRVRTWEAYLQEVRSMDYKKMLSEAPLQTCDLDLTGKPLTPTALERIIGAPETFRQLLADYKFAPAPCDGTSFEKALHVMAWLTAQTQYSGFALCRLPDDTAAILRYACGKPFRYAINCRYKAIALTDMLCACGLKAYPILLHSTTGSIHFVCHVWHDGLKKWCVLDPSFNTWFSFGNDVPLSVFELRDMFLSGHAPVIHGYSFNHTTECIDVYENAFMRCHLSNISTWHDCRGERRRSWRQQKETDFSASLPACETVS